MAQEKWWKAAGPDDQFVTVDLTANYHGKCIEADMGDGYAIALGELPEADSHVTVGGIPFYIGKREAGDSLDVGLACWPKAAEDPRPIYSHYGPSGKGDPQVPSVNVPKQYYSAAYLLCIADTSEGKTPVVSFRLGERNALFNSAVRVPRWNEAPNDNVVASANVALIQNTGRRVKGNVFVVRAPLASGDTKQYIIDPKVATLGLELTKELHIAVRYGPDPTRYRIRPLGLPSAVHVIGLTLERSPVQMTVTSPEMCNVFDYGKTPVFAIDLENITGRSKTVTIAVEVTDWYGDKQNKALEAQVPALGKQTVSIELPQEKRGWYAVVFRLIDGSGRQMLERNTTFALLPPDDREAEKDSPFGLWPWAHGYFCPPGVSNKMMRKAGARYTLGGGDPEAGIYAGTSRPGGRGFFGKNPEENARNWVDNMKTRDQRYWLCYWEKNLGVDHMRHYPHAMLGLPPAELTENEANLFKNYYDYALAYCKLAKEEVPEKEISFGNTTANFLEEFMRAGFPPELWDAIGLEMVCFNRMPERQPEIHGLQEFYFLQEWKKMYGYENHPTIVSEAIYHNTSPGSLTQREQSDYYVRDHLIGLAYGVKLFGMVAGIGDADDFYYDSNWGAIGLLHGWRRAEGNPKPSFSAYANMTRVLDRAQYVKFLDTGSKSVFALLFTHKDGQNVYPMWTLRGKRQLTLALSSDAPVQVIDCMSNETALTSVGQALTVEISTSPVYVKTAAEVVGIKLGVPQHSEQPPEGAVLLEGLDNLGRWKIIQGRDEELDDNNYNCPRRPGNFEYSMVEDPERGRVIEVDPLPAEGPSMIPMYGALQPSKEFELAGEPRKLGLWVKGNSGWGRVLFELIDAEGERWISIGAPRMYNVEDTWTESHINFDGWRWVEIGLCGTFDGEYHLPRHANWKHDGGDGKVQYPVKLNRLILELRDKVVHVNELIPLEDQKVRLSNLTAIYDAYGPLCLDD